MKFALISDTHEQHKNINIPKVDYLIHAGDFTNVGREDALIHFNGWAKSHKEAKTFKKIILVPGNHDLSLDVRYKTAINFLPDIDHILIHEGMELDGLKVWGCSFTPTFFNWAFMRNEDDLYWIYNQIPVGLDILICHGPPRGYLDWNGREHVGSSALREVIEYKQPRYLICGHIHTGRGAQIIRHHNGKSTTIINCSNMDQNYNPVPPIILEL